MLTKRVEFHQARIQIAVKIVDDERSYGVKNMEIVLLLNTAEEWAAAREQISKAMEQIEVQANADGD